MTWTILTGMKPQNFRWGYKKVATDKEIIVLHSVQDGSRSLHCLRVEKEALDRRTWCYVQQLGVGAQRRHRCQLDLSPWPPVGLIRPRGLRTRLVQPLLVFIRKCLQSRAHKSTFSSSFPFPKYVFDFLWKGSFNCVTAAGTRYSADYMKTPG